MLPYQFVSSSQYATIREDDGRSPEIGANDAGPRLTLSVKIRTVTNFGPRGNRDLAVGP
jgi:hypothetical protein